MEGTNNIKHKQIIVEACSKYYKYEYKSSEIECDYQSGLTNYVYKVLSTKLHHEFKVIIRIFGTQTAIFTNRKRENMAYKSIREQKITPKMLFVTDDYRLEEFIETVDYNQKDLYMDKDNLTKVAFTLAKLHQTQLPKEFERKSLIMEAIDGPVIQAFAKKCQKGEEFYTKKELLII